MFNSTKLIIFISFVTSISITTTTLFIIMKFEIETDTLQSLLNFSGVVLGGVVGGYVAYIASNMQIKANNDLENYKELKKEFSACLVALENLKTNKKRLSKFDKDTSYIQVAKYIEITSLENFKNNYLYLLNEEKSSKFCSALNRLTLIKLQDNEEILQIIKIKSLVTHIEEVEHVINETMTNLRATLNDLKKSP